MYLWGIICDGKSKEPSLLSSLSSLMYHRSLAAGDRLSSVASGSRHGFSSSLELGPEVTLNTTRRLGRVSDLRTTYKPDLSIETTVMIVAACLFILGFATTWAPWVHLLRWRYQRLTNECSGIWILIGETFPTRTRAKQGALATASNWLWNFLLAFFTPFIVSTIGFSYGFVFAGKATSEACPEQCGD